MIRNERGWPYLLVGLASLALLAVGARLWGLPDPGNLVIFLVLVLLVSSHVEPETGSRIGVSVSTTIVLAAVPIIGIVGAGIVGFVSTWPDWPRTTPLVRFFNSGMVGILSMTSAIVYSVLAPDAVPGGEAAGVLVVQVGLPLLLAAAWHISLNAFLLGLARRIRGGPPVSRFALELLRSTGASYVFCGVLAFIFVVLWGPSRLGPFAAVLLLLPLAVGSWTLRRYAAETRARDLSVETFVAALEAKAPGAAERAERVSTLATTAAQEVDLPGHIVRSIGYAARLHQIDLLTHPRDEVRRTLAAPPGEVVALCAAGRAQRATVVRELLGGVDFLAEGAAILVQAGDPDAPMPSRLLDLAVDVDRRLRDLETHGWEPSQAQSQLRSELRADTDLDIYLRDAMARAVVRLTPTPSEAH